MLLLFCNAKRQDTMHHHQTANQEPSGSSEAHAATASNNRSTDNGKPYSRSLNDLLIKGIMPAHEEKKRAKRSGSDARKALIGDEHGLGAHDPGLIRRIARRLAAIVTPKPERGLRRGERRRRRAAAAQMTDSCLEYVAVTDTYEERETEPEPEELFAEPSPGTISTPMTKTRTDRSYVLVLEGVSAVGKSTFLRHAARLPHVTLAHNDYTDMRREDPVYEAKHQIPVIDMCYTFHLMHRIRESIREFENMVESSPPDTYQVMLHDRFFYTNILYTLLFAFNGDTSFALFIDRLHADTANGILATVKRCFRQIDDMLEGQVNAVVFVDNEDPTTLVERFCRRQYKNGGTFRQRSMAREYILTQNWLFTMMATEMPKTTKLISLNGKTVTDAFEEEPFF